MSSKTPNYNLHKIDLTDAPPDITVLNQNWDTIDRELGAVKEIDKTVEAIVLEHEESTESHADIRKEISELSESVDKSLETVVAKSGDTMTGALVAGGTQDATPQVRNITFSTTDLTAGESELATGSLYFVYEE